MKYVWSDMPAGLLQALANSEPERAAKAGEDYCTSKGVSARVGTGRGEPALLTFQGMSRWLHGPRKIVAISVESLVLLSVWEPRFSALPFVEDRPWQKGIMFHLGERASSEALVYAEPLEGKMAGIRYIVWSRLISDGTWGTALPKGGESEDLDTYSTFDHLLGTKSKLAITPDGTRLPLDGFRAAAVNALAAMFEDPLVLFGSRKAPTVRGKEGGVHRVTRLTLSYDGTRLITHRWATLDAKTKAEEQARSETRSRTHASPCLHTVEPHHWRVWINVLRGDETAMETRKRTREDGSTFVQYRVSRLRGKEGAYSRGHGIRPIEQRLVTGPGDL